MLNKFGTFTYCTKNHTIDYHGLPRNNIARKNLFISQPRKPGSLPTHSTAGNTLVGAGHVTLSKKTLLYGVRNVSNYCFHIQVIHFKCKERDLIAITNNINFLI